MKLIKQEEIESKIFTVRGLQVMLASDLALLYQVETKVLNQAVKRNIDRFPESFRFQLTSLEAQELKILFLKSEHQNDASRSQFVTLNDKRG